jgi:hypothetical protein
MAFTCEELSRFLNHGRNAAWRKAMRSGALR